MHSGSITLGGLQTNSSNVQGGLSSAKVATEPNTYGRNLRSRGLHELGPMTDHAGGRIRSPLESLAHRGNCETFALELARAALRLLRRSATVRCHHCRAIAED